MSKGRFQLMNRKTIDRVGYVLMCSVSLLMLAVDFIVNEEPVIVSHPVVMIVFVVVFGTMVAARRWKVI